MEVELCGLEEAVFEVVEVKEYRVLVEGGLRIAVREIKLTGTTQLDVRQLANGLFQQCLFLQGVAPASLASATDSIEERERSQVGLQLAQLVITDCQHLGHR